MIYERSIFEAVISTQQSIFIAKLNSVLSIYFLKHYYYLFQLKLYKLLFFYIYQPFIFHIFYIVQQKKTIKKVLIRIANTKD
jgi:hypothetical protein